MTRLAAECDAPASLPLVETAGDARQQHRRRGLAALAIVFLFAAVLLARYEDAAEYEDIADVESKEGMVYEVVEAVGAGVGTFGGATDIEVVSAGGRVVGKDYINDGTGSKGGGLGGSLNEWPVGDPIDVSANKAKYLPQLLDDLRAAKVKFDEYLRTDYGDFVPGVFNRTSVMRAFSRPSEVSERRLKRRMKMKVIEAQLNNGLDGEENQRTTFTWITGGHSAAAAHGNLLNQSYSAQLGRASSIVFEAAGIDFQAKNYAMGGTTSGPEISLCMEAIFGASIDVLQWDYGMTDGRRGKWLYWLWGNRAGVHPTIPTLFAYSNQRDDIHAKLEEAGLAAFSLNNIDALRAKFPDSATHPSPEELPRAVAWYMCSGHPENNDPCHKYKWATNPPCQKASFQSSWHNGWKDHTFIGSLQAVLMVELLVEAVAELSTRDNGETPSISEAYLKSLKSEEHADRTTFLKSPYPDDIGSGSSIGLDWSSFLRGKSICHSARLPSEARFQGLVTGGKKGVHVGHGYHIGYDLGYASYQALPAPKPEDNSTPPMLTVLENRQACTTPLQEDYKDGFVIRKEDGWMTAVYPTISEVEALADRSKIEREGRIMICLQSCDWGKCTAGYVKVDEISSKDNGLGGNLTIIVDGQPVVGTRFLKPDCYVLEAPGRSLNFGPGTVDGRRGQYEIMFRVNKPRGKLIISSIVVI